MNFYTWHLKCETVSPLLCFEFKLVCVAEIVLMKTVCCDSSIIMGTLFLERHVAAELLKCHFSVPGAPHDGASIVLGWRPPSTMEMMHISKTKTYKTKSTSLPRYYCT